MYRKLDIEFSTSRGNSHALTGTEIDNEFTFEQKMDIER